MSGGTRPCYFQASIEHLGKWYCRKCYRSRIRVPPRPKPKKKHKLIPEHELVQLHKNVKQYREKGVDQFSAKVIVNEILPKLLEEIMHLRKIRVLDD